jgi:hypothetical protein
LHGGNCAFGGLGDKLYSAFVLKFLRIAAFDAAVLFILQKKLKNELKMLKKHLF